jgi:hypothetical protein
MAKAKDRMNDAVDAARPYVERLARDEELHDHVKSAYDSYWAIAAPPGWRSR